MRLVITQYPLKRLCQWTQRLCFTAAISLLAYCGFVLGDTWTFQNAQNRELERRLTAEQTPAASAGQIVVPIKTNALRVFEMTGLIGRIEIPRLGLTAIVMEGTTRSILRRAVGHIAGTVLPGELGNVGISGHRDTFFRPLRNIQPNDIISLITPLGEYRYRVSSTRIVSPSDIAVLDSSGGETLTLVTCYPFYFVGSAPDRFIVLAERVGDRSL